MTVVGMQVFAFRALGTVQGGAIFREQRFPVLRVPRVFGMAMGVKLHLCSVIRFIQALICEVFTIVRMNILAPICGCVRTGALCIDMEDLAYSRHMRLNGSGQ